MNDDALSKSQIDRLGDRLRNDSVSDDDLALLDRFRRSFAPAYERVVAVLRGAFGLSVTGRPAKTTTAIREKLRRKSIRLTQMQDVAGCRIVVSDSLQQDAVVTQLEEVLPIIAIVDRRLHPSHGYRAVHAVAKLDEVLIEVQVRTELQHLWAEVSEKCADLDPGIKYGTGAPWLSEHLLRLSDFVERQEVLEARTVQLQQRVGTLTIEVESLDTHVPERLALLGELQQLHAEVAQNQELTRDSRGRVTASIRDILEAFKR